MKSSNTVEALMSLQEIDDRIAEKEEELSSLMPEIREAEARLQTMEEDVESAREELEELEKEYRSDQRSVEAARSTLKRLQARAEEVETMKQHQAVRSELSSARENLEAAEERALDNMQRVDRVRDRVEELEEELEEAREDVRSRTEDARSHRERLEAELASERDRRETRTVELDDEVVELYERVREGRTQNVLAPLDGNHCGHCFTMVPLQRQAEIRSGRKLHRCEGCGVILHAAQTAHD